MGVLVSVTIGDDTSAGVSEAGEETQQEHASWPGVAVAVKQDKSVGSKWPHGSGG